MRERESPAENKMEYLHGGGPVCTGPLENMGREGGQQNEQKINVCLPN